MQPFLASSSGRPGRPLSTTKAVPIRASLSGQVRHAILCLLGVDPEHVRVPGLQDLHGPEVAVAVRGDELDAVEVEARLAVYAVVDLG